MPPPRLSPRALAEVQLASSCGDPVMPGRRRTADGAAIRKARLALGIGTQRAFADLAGVSERTISNAERGLRLEEKTLMKIAEPLRSLWRRSAGRATTNRWGGRTRRPPMRSSTGFPDGCGPCSVACRSCRRSRSTPRSPTMSLFSSRHRTQNQGVSRFNCSKWTPIEA